MKPTMRPVIGLVLLGMLLVNLQAPTPSAIAQNPDTTEIVSLDSNSVQGNDNSIAPSISADGRYVAFTSDADNLVPGDTNGFRDVFVHDRQTGQTTRVSIASDGTQANADSRDYTAISDDGRYVAFSSDATNLVPNDTNGWKDVFVHDRQTGQTIRASIASDGTEANWDSALYSAPSLSADGTLVAFDSIADNLVEDDTNSRSDVFIHDVLTRETTRLSVDAEGGQLEEGGRYPSISDSALYVAFDSVEWHLITDTNWTHDVFVLDRWNNELSYVSVSSDGTIGDNISTWPSISADGRYVAFESQATNLVPNDTNGWQDVFVHDRETGQTIRASVASDGTQSDWESGLPSISPDGRFVAFRSRATNLVPGDTNYVYDIFVHDLATRETTRVSIASNDAEGSGGHAFLAAASEWAGHVAFGATFDNLVSGDSNDARDIFVRIRQLPPPPPTPATLQLTANPDYVIPMEYLTRLDVELLGPDGAPVEWAKVYFEIQPNEYGDRLGTLLDQECTTDFNGQCYIFYRAPTPEAAYQHGHGVELVTVKASSGGLWDDAEIFFIYLQVVQVYPPHGTRNWEWTTFGPLGDFDREIEPSTVHADSFEVSSSWHYRDGINCEYLTVVPKQAWCVSDLEDEQSYPDADKGLVITSKFKGGPEGIRGTDGTFLRSDYSWQVRTTPVLSPTIIPVQISEGADLISGKPTVVRVHAGLSPQTELDWVQADVSLSEATGGSLSRPAHQFYAEELGGPLPVKLKGNSANFYSQNGEVPWVNSPGTYVLSATLTPSNQPLPPSGGPRSYSTSTTAKVREVRLVLQTIMDVLAHPIAPAVMLRGETYPWKVGSYIYDLPSKPIGKNQLLQLSGLFPRYGKVGYQAKHKVLSVFSDNLSMKDGQRYLEAIARRNGYRLPVAAQAAVMIVPTPWMVAMNNGDLFYYNAKYRLALLAEDANIAAASHLLGQIYGLRDIAPGAGTLKGYNLDLDRYINSDYAELGYSIPLMRRDIANLPAGQEEEVWIDQQSYQELMEIFTLPAPTAPSSQPEQGGEIAIGGAIWQEDGSETGTFDVIELPARNPIFSAPEGSGDYSLQLRDGGGAILATHAFSPSFGLAQGQPYASFLFTFPAPGETRQIELWHGSSVLTTVLASANPPTVSLVAPVAGSYSGTVEIAWQADDADADDLYFSLYYSADDGDTWRPLMLGTLTPTYSLDTTQYANALQGRLKVVATDGFFSAEAESDPFSVSNPPQVLFVWPEDGASGVSPHSTIGAVFRDAMDPSSIDALSLRLFDERGQPFPPSGVSYHTLTQRLEFTSALALDLGKPYTATLSGSVRDMHGQELGSDLSWSFQAGGWQPAVIYLPLTMRQE